MRRRSSLVTKPQGNDFERDARLQEVHRAAAAKANADQSFFPRGPGRCAALATAPMNNPRFCDKWMAVGYTVCALFSVAWADPVSAYRGDRPTPFDVAVERGMSRGLAQQLAGEPDARFGADIWIYVNCRLTKDATPTSDNDTLCTDLPPMQEYVTEPLAHNSQQEAMTSRTNEPRSWIHGFLLQASD
jgi:hypothetical protein